MKMNLKNIAIGLILALHFITIDANFFLVCIVMLVYGFAFPPEEITKE